MTISLISFLAVAPQGLAAPAAQASSVAKSVASAPAPASASSKPVVALAAQASAAPAVAQNNGNGPDKDPKEKKEQEDKIKFFNEALAQAILNDKANASKRYDVVLPYNTSGLTSDQSWGKDKKGSMFSSSQSAQIRSAKLLVSASGSDGVISQERATFVVHLVTRSQSKAAMAVLDDCEDKAKVALNSQGKLRLSMQGIGHNALFVSQAEQIRGWGYQMFWSKMETSKKKVSVKFKDFKEFLESIDDVVKMRSGLSVDLDKQAIRCELE